MGLQDGDGGALYGATNSTITVQQSTLSYNSATVRALANETEKPSGGDGAKVVWRGKARLLGSGRMRTAGCIAVGRVRCSVRVWAWWRLWARGTALGPLGTRTQGGG